MKTVLQFVRNKRGVTATEYLLIGYFICIFLSIGAKTVGPNFNPNVFIPPANALDGGKIRGGQ
jgi:Flp pilus assembly pilin Flp